MSRKSLYFAGITAVIAVLLPLYAYAQDTLPLGDGGAEVALDRQLKINKEMLLKGTSEQIRMDAAAVMLFSEDIQARKILIDVLNQSENSAARAAVCRVLSQTRATQEEVRNKHEFIIPLFGILLTESGAVTRLAAEAILIFDYEQIAEPLETMAFDPSIDVKARLNAIDALKLQPDMRAIFKLIELTDDAQSEVSGSARGALGSLAIPVGQDARAKSELVYQLRRDGIVKFQRSRLIQQEARMRELQEKSDFWKGLYLGSLDKIYASIAEDSDKGKFLVEYLSASEDSVRLWALDKVYQARVGTKTRFPSELEPKLISLISDPDREVRLNTARLLSLMGELNSSRRLLDQLKVEQDSEIAVELFVALGKACYYAFLPDSKINISPEIRQETLKLASEYLLHEDPRKTQRGAEVIEKLLEQDGLDLVEVNKYLALLASRYSDQKNSLNGDLQGELLNVMAGVCAQSVYKAEAARLFRPLFEQSLRDKTDLVREAAVNGLIYIDKTKALNKLRLELVNDSSSKVREKIISLAGDVGSKEDLLWLGEKLGSATENELSWDAMLKIFRRCDAAVAGEWVGRFLQGVEVEESVLSNEQRVSFFEIAEQKVLGEKKLERLGEIRGALAELYKQSGDYKRSAEYFGLLIKQAQNDAERQRSRGGLLDVYLLDSNIQMATELMENYLLEQDLEPNSVLFDIIDGYFSHSEKGEAEKANFLKSLGKLDISERTNWKAQLKLWGG